MIPLSVKVPFAGEAVSVFKSACEYMVHSEVAESKLSPLSDEEYKFSESITVGVFRLLMDGTLTLVDKDLENQVSLMTIAAKDRGGKGKIDATLRLFATEDELACEAEVTPKGMIARAELPIKEVFNEKISAILKAAIAEADIPITVDSFDFDEDETEEFQKPIWVVILQLPATIFTFPINLLRSMASSF